MCCWEPVADVWTHSRPSDKEDIFPFDCRLRNFFALLNYVKNRVKGGVEVSVNTCPPISFEVQIPFKFNLVLELKSTSPLSWAVPTSQWVWNMTEVISAAFKTGQNGENKVRHTPLKQSLVLTTATIWKPGVSSKFPSNCYKITH